jgi:hypothetical protein
LNFYNNQSALSVAKNPDHHGRVKHLDLRFYWLRDEVERGIIRVEHIPTDINPADIIFTKALSCPKTLDMLALLALQVL